jgi:hypothetical protein
MEKADFIDWLKTEIKNTEKDIKVVNRELARVKLNVLVGNEWFEEFDSRVGCVLDYNGISVEFVESPTTIHF